MSNTQNNIETLRTALFDTLADLRNKNNPMDIDRAKAVCEVGQTIINTARVEIDFARATGQDVLSEFISTPQLPAPTTPAAIGKPSIKTGAKREPRPFNTSHPAPGVTQHRCE